MLELGPDEPSATTGSVSMTMAFAVVALSAVNLGVVMRRERQAPWSTPMFPYFGWLIAGWVLTWAAVELGMLQRLLDTVSLSGEQWLVAIGLSLITPAFVGVDRAIQIRRLRDASDSIGPSANPSIERAAAVTPGTREDLMAKHPKGRSKARADAPGPRPSPPSGRLRRKDYERELERLQVELVHLQQWVVATGAKVCIVFEGRDTAGKGGVIKRITERVSPRVFRVVALPAPNDRERTQMYIQRYLPHLPAGARS